MITSKGFIRKCSKLLLIAVLSAIPLGLVGCGAIDNTVVNTALVNSSLMQKINETVQEQISDVQDLKNRGFLSASMANGLEASLGTIGAAVATVTGETVSVGSKEEAKAKNEFIDRVLKATTFKYYGTPPVPSGYATSVTDQETAKDYEGDHGSFLAVYQGFQTTKLIEASNYASSITGDRTALEPLGVGAANIAESVLKYIKDLGNLDVYYLKPNVATNTTSLQRIKDEILKAQGTGDTTELMKDFARSDKEINLTVDELSVKDIYDTKTIQVDEAGYNQAEFEIYLLDKEAIIKAVSADNKELNLSSGVLIGNQFYITKYPVAVFRGFEVDDANPSQFIPVFVPPNLVDTSTIKGSMFTDDSDVLSESLDTSGGKSTSLDKITYIDIFTGAYSYKGEDVNKSVEYMSTGTRDVESSFVVKSSANVWKTNSNPDLITTVPQKDKYRPVDTVDLGAVVIDVPQDLKDVGELPIFFLMDYLELIYSPGTVGSDLFTAFGRKIKLDEGQILGKLPIKPDTTASLAYITGHGTDLGSWTKPSDNFAGLGIDQFLDLDGFYSTGSGLTPKPSGEGNENENTSVVRVIQAGNQYAKGGTIYHGDSTAERSDHLPQIAAGKGVECVIRFGASGLNQADESSKPKTPLFGILVYGGVYERDLMTGWILGSNNANLLQWDKTLMDLGYKNYNISGSVLDEKLKGNYAFELTENGLLNLDMNMVIDINKDNLEARRGGALVLLRTVLLIVGFSLIAYVSVLLAAWSLDVNLDLGINLLSKVSFGHFVAVRSLDEMPGYDPQSTTTYVDFKKLVLRCFAFATVGIVILTVDPVDTVVSIMTGLKFLLDVISRKIFGVNIM